MKRLAWYEIKDKNCPDCGKLIMRIANYCQSCWQTGKRNPYWKGGLPKCLDCNKELKLYRSKRCLSCSTRYTMMQKTGEKHWNWRGGIKRPHLMTSDKLERIRFREEMQKLIFERDDYTCQICKERGGKLQVDHIQPWAEYVEQRFSMDNCRTLCMGCHYKITFNKSMPKKIQAWGHNMTKGGELKFQV